jgi:hypothetical protein
MQSDTINNKSLTLLCAAALASAELLRSFGWTANIDVLCSLHCSFLLFAVPSSDIQACSRWHLVLPSVKSFTLKIHSIIKNLNAAALLMISSENKLCL